MTEKISIGILTYNHERFIEQCLESVFDLSYPNLEIIISDDASVDSTFLVIQNFINNKSTQHKVILNKNEKNLGLSSNFNKVFGDLATGDYLITLGGDDAIRENYLVFSLELFAKKPDVMMIDFCALFIDGNNNLIPMENELPYQQKIFTLQDYLEVKPIQSFAPGRILRKELINSFLPISPDCPTEDSVLVLRSLLLGCHMRVNKKVILYRKHNSNVSSMANLRRMSNSQIISQYLNDVLYLYKQNIITDLLFPSLLDRINIELKRRESLYGIKEEIQGKKKLCTIIRSSIKRFVQKLK